jgi:hypothetical protein
MITTEHDNLAADLSILGKKAVLSMSARQRVRDNLFKKIGQIDLIDAVQTKTEVPGLVMPLSRLISIFKPATQVRFSWGATTAVGLAVMALTFTTGALANNAEPGSGVFYTVRKALESAQIALQTDPAKKAELQLAIANNRLQTLQSADPKNLQAVLDESRKALTDAQTAVSSLDKGAASEDLSAKLTAIISSQKVILTTILEANPDNDAIQKGALAVRDALDKLLPADETPATITVTDLPASSALPAEPAVSQGNPQGTLITAGGLPALNTGQSILTINNIPAGVLSQYVGSSKTEVVGTVSGTAIEAAKIFIDSKLVWETPSKNNNNLPGVEPSQN